MNKTAIQLAIVLAAAIAGQTAFAQTATREEVKKEAATANKTGATKGGDVAAPMPAAKPASTAARTDVKKNAAAANKAGQTKGGDAAPMAAAPTGPAASRADVKKEAAAANKAGQTAGGEVPKK